MFLFCLFLATCEKQDRCILLIVDIILFDVLSGKLMM